MRLFLLLVLVLLMTVPAEPHASPLVRMAADSLVARHQAMPTGGWAWRSSIQAPHHHTDRDVGAASVGEGLLAAYSVTRDARYRRAAVAAGDYLLGVAEPAAGGLRWPDWADPDGERSTTHFTSFDDGAAGISDYLWKLFRVTRERRFRAAALAGMRWVVSRAECSRNACSWAWTDDPSWRVAYHGVGMGQAGIVLALDAFADRTGDRTFRSYARAGAARLRRLTANGTRPLPRGSEDPTAETGFLSGSAGAAFMFLDRFEHDRDPADLATARRLLRWVNDQAVADGSGGLYWPISRGSEAMPAGFELGAAGIAWVNLRAVSRHRRSLLPRSRPPGGRLVAVGGDRGIGLGGAPGRPDRPRPCRARQRGRRDRLGAGRPRARGHRARREPRRRASRRSPACAAKPSATGSGRSGTRTGWGACGAWAPSRPGTGARPGSRPSPRASPAGPAAGPAARASSLRLPDPARKVRRTAG